MGINTKTTYVIIDQTFKERSHKYCIPHLPHLPPGVEAATGKVTFHCWWHNLISREWICHRNKLIFLCSTDCSTMLCTPPLFSNRAFGGRGARCYCLFHIQKSWMFPWSLWCIAMSHGVFDLLWFGMVCIMSAFAQHTCMKSNNSQIYSPKATMSN